jgi:hypothetical protein
MNMSGLIGGIVGAFLFLIAIAAIIIALARRKGIDSSHSGMMYETEVELHEEAMTVEDDEDPFSDSLDRDRRRPFNILDGDMESNAEELLFFQ